VSSQRPPVKNRLRHFIGDGIWASVCDGVAESNFTAFATALSASPGQLSVLLSSQSLLGCWLQLWSEKLIFFFGSRKRVVLTLVSLQVATLATMILATFFEAGPLAFMGLMLLFVAFGSTSGAVWNSWISDLLPARRRGYCFGVRNQRTYPASSLALVAAGAILLSIESALGGGRGTQIAFCVIFFIGLTAKLLSLRHLALQPDGQCELPTRALGPIELVKTCYRDRGSRQVLCFFGVMGFAVSVSAAFQAPYLLTTLHLNYLQFTLVTAVFVISRFLAAPWVGRIADRRGSRQPFLISAALMPLVALGWALSTNFYALLLTQIFAGMIWTGFDLFSFTFLTESTGSAYRQRIFAAKNVAWNLAAFAGALAGGALGSFSMLPALVFWVSFAGRGAAALFLLRVSQYAPESESSASLTSGTVTNVAA